MYIDIDVISILTNSHGTYGLSLFLTEVPLTEDNIGRYDKQLAGTVDMKMIGRNTYTLDLSNVNGEWYVDVIAQLAIECRGKIYNIWLEK